MSADFVIQRARQITTKSQLTSMHHEEIELNFDASCQQIIGLESEILWEAYVVA
jgi:hypothetical protein